MIDSIDGTVFAAVVLNVLKSIPLFNISVCNPQILIPGLVL